MGKKVSLILTVVSGFVFLEFVQWDFLCVMAFVVLFISEIVYFFFIKNKNI